MPWATLKKAVSVFFCCQEPDEIQDDSSHHLIPSESVESPMIYSSVISPDHQQLQERMGLIVRTKEGKMVNVASRMPFNLHNKVIPPERFYGSVSQSTTGSLDQRYGDHDYQADYSRRDIAHQRHFYVSALNDRLADRSRSVSPSSGQSGRNLSTTLDRPMPTPILNVRLVGYPDNINKPRGRMRDRSSRLTDLSDPTNGTTTQVEDEEAVATVENTETSCEGSIAASSFKLRDVGSITLNWND